MNILHTILSSLLLLGFTPLLASGASPVDFNRQVRPILSAKCFACHGPDEEARQADLRLDLPVVVAGEPAESGVIVPGSPEKSEFYLRITAADPDLRMPPANSHKTLDQDEIDLFRQWINEGAEYETLWSFVPPKPVALPEVNQTSWPRNAIDYFVLRKIEDAGLTPSPRANLDVLARRVSLDLVGLTPSPEQLDDFLANVKQSGFDKAYEQFVDRLLATPHYGEHLARRWLDLARYADTNGYEKDRERSIWAYRDWVISALNDDMPFDQFTLEQIAGDMLPDPTVGSRIATGFHRNTMLNEEGGIDPLEYRFYAMTDRVATTGTAWLGMTIGCAQCHTHKYDPISQQEYYKLMAFLNNASEPDMTLPDTELEKQHQHNLARAERLVQQLPEHWPVEGNQESEGGASESHQSQQSLAAARQRYQEWLKTERKNAVAWQPLHPIEASSNMPRLGILDDDSILASGDTTKADTYTITYRAPQAKIAAVRLEVLPHESLPGGGPGMTYYEGTKGDFFLGDFKLSADGDPVVFSKASQSLAAIETNQPVSAQMTIDNDLQTGWSILGGSGKRHVAVYTLAQPVERADSFELTMRFGRYYASSLGRFRLSFTTVTPPAEARAIPPVVEQALLTTPDKLTPEQEQTLWEHFLLTAPELTEFANEIRQLREPPQPDITLVMKERPENNPRATHVHHRGEFLQPTKRVEPGVPEVLHDFNDDWPRNRLGLAHWLVAPDNPLTSRVVVNRQWADFFGEGIVRTIDDFGVLGTPPTHPKLLDWLAVEFVERGWSLKHLRKLMVMSETYLQSSDLTENLRRADPDNRLLARAPRRRLSAEVIRDCILGASGLLSSKMGGPGVRPPQPPELTQVALMGPPWVASTGEDRYRRSIYTFQKRSAPFAMFDTFDAPSRESCKAQRDSSNTPLQALTLLNDVMFIEAAQAMGRLLADHGGDDDERVSYAFRRMLARTPNEQETSDLLAFVREQRNRLEAGELSAETIAGGPEPPVTERAVWTSLARVLFGLDESITRN